MGHCTFPVPLPACSSARGTGAFPSTLCSSMAAPLLGTLQPGSAWEGHASKTDTGLGGGQVFPCSLLLPDPR